jgi:hypothetical protein
MAVTVRVCAKCGEEKDLLSFGASKMHKDGRRRDCKECMNAYRRERYKSPEVRDRIKGNTKRWNEANPLAWKQAYLMRTYNITLDEYQALYDAQGGCCALCRNPEQIVGSGKGKSMLAVDHDHETGKVRGLLCFRCNTSLGAFGDSVEGLRRAIAYIEGDILYSQDEVAGWL